MSAHVTPVGEVVFHVPATLDLDAAQHLEGQFAAVSPDVPVQLDFGAVKVCHGFVFAVLLSKVASLRRLAPVHLVHLNPQQRKLVAHLNLGSAFNAGEEEPCRPTGDAPG